MMNNIDGKKIVEYLNTLGLSTKDVLTIGDLKTNYRKLAKYYHPDNHETGDDEQFKKVQEAYDYCQENLEYVNEQIKANFTINASGFSSKEEEAFAMTALRAAASMRIFGFELNEQLTHKKLDENYYKLSILFQTILKDFKRLKVLNDAYAFLKENFDFVNILIACQFDYNLFKAARAKADELKREQERKDAEERAAREKAEKERKEREALERRRAEEARLKAEQERKRREVEERARREQEKKEAQLFYKNRLEEEMEKIILSAYSDKNRNTVKVIFDAFRKKEAQIQTKNSAIQTVSVFKDEIKKVKTIKQQKIIKKRLTLSGIITACMAILVGIGFGIKGIVDEVNRKNTFEHGVSLMQSGDYSTAKTTFESLGNYKTSKNKAIVCDGLIMLDASRQTKTETDAIAGIKKVLSGGESVHVYYDSSSGHNVRRNRLSFDDSQYDEVISSPNFTLHKPNSSLNNGYTFGHWFSNSLKYEDITMLCMDSTWSVNSYLISYHLDGGINNTSNPKSYTIETNDIYLQDASKQNFTFSGWFDKQNGGNRILSIPKGTTGNIDLYAKYEINHYTVNFYNWDYEKLYTTTVDHGGSVSYPYGNPTKPKDQQYSYSFSGWDKPLNNIVANTDFVAQFSNTVNQYTVTFKNYDGTILGTDTVDYGSTASYSGEIPEKPISLDNRKSYVFSGWDISLNSIKDNCVAVAQYDEIDRFLAKFYNGDELLYSTMLNEGEVPVFVGENPTKDSTQQYSFEFSYWNPTPEAIHSDMAYQPVFTSTLNQYTVTFKNYDGTILGISTVDYGTSASYLGEIPTKPKTQQYSYSFSGWDLDLSCITDDIETTALFSETINQYTVTFKNYNGSILGTSTVDYGGTAEYSGSTPMKPKTQQYSFAFSGWNISLENITSDRDAVAQYNSTVNQYTVTFKNYDGTVLWTDTVDYGTSANYGGTTPTKPDSKGCSYSFSGWDKSFNQVLNDVTVTATFEAELINGVFELNSDGKTYKLVSCTREETLLIPAKHNGLPITRIGERALGFSGYPSGGPADPQRTLLHTVELSEGLKYIENSAFRFNSNLQTIVLPRSLVSIGSFAFGNTGFSEDCIIRKNVTQMGERVFFEVHNRVLCEAESKPSGWDTFWNENDNGGGGRNVVVWGYKD